MSFTPERFRELVQEGQDLVQSGRRSSARTGPHIIEYERSGERRFGVEDGRGGAVDLSEVEAVTLMRHLRQRLSNRR